MKACFKPFNHAAFIYWNFTACATISKYHSSFSSTIPLFFFFFFLKSSEYKNLSTMTRSEGEKKILTKTRPFSKADTELFSDKNCGQNYFSGSNLTPILVRKDPINLLG